MREFGALLCAWALTLAASASPASAQNPAADAAQNTQSADSTLNNCLVQSVAAFPNRVHILCTVMPTIGLGGAAQPSSATVRYFAVENTVAQNAMALAVLNVANAAMQRNRSLTVIYRTNPNNNPAGCNANDCRRVVGVIMN